MKLTYEEIKALYYVLDTAFCEDFVDDCDQKIMDKLLERVVNYINDSNKQKRPL